MSCCACGNWSCGGNCAYIVNLPDNPVAAYSTVNGNLAGVGVYDSTFGGVQFVMRGINSGNAMLGVTLDAANRVVLLTIDATAIAAAFPAATTAQAGILETATDAEAIAKGAVDKILTPSNLAAIGATQTFAGLIEIATNAETQAGVSAVLAVTPAGLASVVATLEQTATFANAVARVALAPAFEGQFGYQIDTNQTYVGTSVVAGDWQIVFVEGIIQTIDENTEIELDGCSFNFSGSGTLNIGNDVTNFVGTTVNSQTSWAHQGNWEFVNSALDFDNTTVQIGGANVANSVLISGGTNLVSSQLINTFVSSANTQTGYTNFTNPAVLRTCDTATVTLPQLAQIVGTLINDLKAIRLPAT